MNMLFEGIGYVIHIHDTVNYDIAFPKEWQTNDNFIETYRNVTSSQYTFMDYQWKNNQWQSMQPIEAYDIAYRCRIKGVGIHTIQKSQSMSRDAYIELSRHIDGWNGWVWCQLFEVDTFSRILVHIYSPKKENIIMPLFFSSTYDKLFYRYSS